MIIHEVILFPSIVNLSCFSFQTQHPGVRELIIIYSLLCIQAKTLEYKLSLQNASCFPQFSVLVGCIISKTKLRGSLKKTNQNITHLERSSSFQARFLLLAMTTQNIEV